MPAGGRQLWLWRAVALIALVLTGAGVLSAPAWNDAGLEPTTPPFERPAIASVLPDATTVSHTLGSPFVLTVAGPPLGNLHTANTPWTISLRNATFIGTWREQFEALDGISTLDVSVFDFRRAQTAETFEEGTCPLDPTEAPDGSQVRFGQSATGPGVTYYCSEILLGRTKVQMELGLATEDWPPETAEERFRALVESVALLWQPDLPAVDEIESVDALLLRSMLAGLLFFAVLSTAPELFFDRGTWERLRNRLLRIRRPRPAEGRIDVELASKLAAARTRTLALTKLAVLIWVVRLVWPHGLYLNVVIAIVFAAYVVCLVVERRFSRRWTRRAPARFFRGAALVSVIVGIALSVVMLFVAARVASVGALGAGGMPGPGVPLWVSQRIGQSYQVLAAVLLAFSVVPLALARRFAMRHARGQENDRAQVLLLRSFVDQNVKMRSRRLDRSSLIDHIAMRRWERFEEVVASNLTKAGEVVTAATPGELLPPGLGAARIQFSHEEWQQRVSEISERSSFIVMVLGRSESMVWEMTRLQELGHMAKTIFVVPPIARAERTVRLRFLADAYGIDRSLVAETKGRAVLAVVFPRGLDHPLVIEAAGPDDISYDLALDSAMTQLLRAEPVALVEPLRTPRLDRLDYIPRGRAKAPKTWKSNPWVWTAILNVGVLTLALPYALGNPIGQAGFRGGVFLQDGQRFTAIARSSGAETLAVVEHRYLTEVDFATEEVSLVGEMPFMTGRVAISGGRAFLASPDKGEVAAMDLGTGDIAWRVPIPGRARAILADGESVYVAVPATGEVLRLGAGDGSTLASAEPGGAPWDLVGGEEGLGAVLVTEDEYVALDGLSLEEYGRTDTMDAPVEVQLYGGRPAVMSRVAGVIEGTDPNGTPIRLLLTRTDSQFAAAGDVLAVAGVERLTVKDAGGAISRFNTDGQPGPGMRIVPGEGVVISETGRLEVLRVFG